MHRNHGDEEMAFIFINRFCLIVELLIKKNDFQNFKKKVPVVDNITVSIELVDQWYCCTA